MNSGATPPNSNSTSFLGPSVGFLDLLGGNSAPQIQKTAQTQSGLMGPSILLEPSPVPMKNTDKNFYRSLFGSIAPIEPPPESVTADSNVVTNNTPLTLKPTVMGFTNQNQYQETRPIQTEAPEPDLFSFPSFTDEQISQQQPNSTFQPPPFTPSFPMSENSLYMNNNQSNSNTEAKNIFSFPSPPATTTTTTLVPQSFNNVPMHQEVNSIQPESSYNFSEPFPPVEPSHVMNPIPFDVNPTSSPTSIGQTNDNLFNFPDFTSPASPTSVEASSPPAVAQKDPMEMMFPPFTSPQAPTSQSSTGSNFQEFNSFQAQTLPSESETLVDISLLMKIFQKLMETERYSEAVECKGQITACKEIQEKTPLLQQAKINQDFVGSLQLRERIECLRSSLLGKAKIDSWRSSSPAKTFAQMQRCIEEKVGKEQGYSFHTAYSAPIAMALQKGDLSSLVALKKDAESKVDAYLTGIPVVKTFSVSLWEQVAQKSVTELQTAFVDLKNVQTTLIEANMENSKVLKAPRLLNFTNGITEIYKLIKRIQFACKYFGQNQTNIYHATSHFSSLWAEADKLWKDLCDFLQSFASINLSSVSDYTCSTSQGSFKSGTCTLCLLPLEGEYPTLKWASQRYHSPCANFYCNRISTSPPSVT